MVELPQYLSPQQPANVSAAAMYCINAIIPTLQHKHNFTKLIRIITPQVSPTLNYQKFIL